MNLTILPVKLYVSMLLAFQLSSCEQQLDAEMDSSVEKTNRIIEFSGYEWVVKSSDEEKQGPGPNFFSDSEENVWVDNDGRLHLKIVRRGGNWYCSGVALLRSLGYHRYVFYISSRVDQLDENVIGGLFTYMNDEEEIDIEFSKWSEPDNENAQFAVQPSVEPGNKKRFDIGLTSNFSTHFFDWQLDKIEFGSYRGHTLEPEAAAVMNAWTYTGNNIPPDSNERLKINLWLFHGKNPSDNKEAEMIIDRIEIY